MGIHDALGNRGMQRLAAMKAPPVSVAARVAPGTIQRTCACNGSEHCGCDSAQALPWVQRKSDDAGVAPSRSLAATALSGQGAGHPLDAASRAFMEPRFGRDLGGVRIHTDAAAARSARMLNAHAFTVGNDVYFAQGRYDPVTPSGRTLLAHELTHTVQQGGGAGGAVAQSSTAVSYPQDASEREANSVAARVAGGSAVAGGISSAPPSFQRQDDGGTAAPPLAQNDGGAPAPTAADAGAPAASTLEDRATRPASKAIIRALQQVDPEAAAGIGNFGEVFRILNGLAMFDMLATLDELRTLGEFQLLKDHREEAVGVNRPRIEVAMVAVGDRATVTEKGFPPEQGQAYSELPADQQADVKAYLGTTPGIQAEPPQGGPSAGEAVLVGVLVSAAIVGGVLLLEVASAGTLTPILAASIIAIQSASGAVAVTELAAGTTVAVEVVAAGVETAAVTGEVATSTALIIEGTTTAATVAPAVAQAAPVAATITVASSSSAATVTAAAVGVTAATTLSSDSGNSQDEKDKRGRRPPCFSDDVLCKYQKRLISVGMTESARRYFVEVVNGLGGDVRLYCSSGHETGDAMSFSAAIAPSGEWCVVQACSRDFEQLGLAFGSKNYDEDEHAEIQALNPLMAQLMLVPEKERSGGQLMSACIKPACRPGGKNHDPCFPKLEDFAKLFLPDGPAPHDIGCGNPKFGLAALAWTAYLHVFEEHCGPSLLSGH